MSNPEGRERLRRLNERVAADNSAILQAVAEARTSGRSATIAFPECTVTLIVKPNRPGIEGVRPTVVIYDETGGPGACSTCNDLGLVDWGPFAQRDSDEDMQPCPDCALGRANATRIGRRLPDVGLRAPDKAPSGPDVGLEDKTPGPWDLTVCHGNDNTIRLPGFPTLGHAMRRARYVEGLRHGADEANLEKLAADFHDVVREKESGEPVRVQVGTNYHWIMAERR